MSINNISTPKYREKTGDFILKIYKGDFKDESKLVAYTEDELLFVPMKDI